MNSNLSYFGKNLKMWLLKTEFEERKFKTKKAAIKYGLSIGDIFIVRKVK